MSVTLVEGPDDPEMMRWLPSLNHPDGGRLAFLVPPANPSFAGVLAAILQALGKPAGANAYQVELPFLLVHATAWLRAHEIDRLVLGHVDWLSPQVSIDIATFGELIGAELVCVGLTGATPFVGWATRRCGWLDLVTEETRAEPARERIAARPDHRQSSPIPLFGIGGSSRAVSPKLREGPALLARLQMEGAIQRRGTTSDSVARELVRVLHGFQHESDADIREAAAGAAGPLLAAGWQLRSLIGWARAEDSSSHGSEWFRLRESIPTAGPAAIALRASGLAHEDTSALPCDGVAPDGSEVRVAGQRFVVEESGRVYVRAHAVVRRLEDASGASPFIAHRGKPFSRAGLGTLVNAHLRTAGIVASRTEITGTLSTSRRWLRDRGLILVRAEPPAGEDLRKQRRCRHGLPHIIEVDGVGLSHSQRLCLAPGPAALRPFEVRPASAGYRLEQLSEDAHGTVWDVRRHGTPAGQIVGLRSGIDWVWLQVGLGEAPAIDRIARCVALEHGVDVAA